MVWAWDINSWETGAWADGTWGDLPVAPTVTQAGGSIGAWKDYREIKWEDDQKLKRLEAEEIEDILIVISALEF